jgi:hypothetical protein
MRTGISTILGSCWRSSFCRHGILELNLRRLAGVSEVEACCRNPERAERVEGSPTRELSGMMARLEKFGFCWHFFAEANHISQAKAMQSFFMQTNFAAVPER